MGGHPEGIFKTGHNFVSSASWDLKIGERVNTTRSMSQKQFQVMVVRTFREKKTSKYEKTPTCPRNGGA